MNKYFTRGLLAVFVVASFFAFNTFVTVTPVGAAAMTTCQTIDALVASGVLTQANANTARLAAGCSTATPTSQLMPVVSITSTPTLRLSYDSRRRESLLTANFRVSVGATTSEALLPHYPFGISLVNGTNGTQVSSTNSGQYNISAVGTTPETRTIDGTKYYVIPKGTMTNFNVTSTAKPSELFAGSYYAKLIGAWAPNLQRQIEISNQTRNVSNKVTIVGETSPYITSVTTPVSVGEKMTINGQRLRGASVFIDNAILSGTPVNSPADGNSLSFILPNLTVGYHSIHLANSTTGQSRGVNFYVSGVIPTLRLVVTPSPVTSVSLGSTNLTIAQINLSAQDGDVALDDISVSGWPAESAVLNSFKLYDGSVLLGKVDVNPSTFVGMGSPNWVISIPASIIISKGTTKTLVLKADAKNIGSVRIVTAHGVGGQAGAEFNTIFDPNNISGQTFSVQSSSTQRSVTITSPNGGENLTLGQVHKIKWDSTTNINKVTIGYSFGTGSLNWIANNIPNTGSYDWTVNIGNTTNTRAKIYIIGYQTGVGSATDYSDDYFNVVPRPTITVVSPNGGETWQVDTAGQIDWNTQGSLSRVYLYLLEQNSSGVWSSNNHLYNGIGSSLATSLSYKFYPSSVQTGQRKIRISNNPNEISGLCLDPNVSNPNSNCSMTGAYVYDDSDSALTIVAPAPTACTSFTYSIWSVCSDSGAQTRTVVSQSPTGCTGGSPVLSQSCTFESPQVSSCATSTIDARDGRTYGTVLIGDQCWMAENLNIGTSLTMADYGNNDSQGTNCSSIKKYCPTAAIHGIGDDSNCPTYGGLYQWDQMMCGSTSAGAQGICPAGWHIPTDNEFKTLEMGLGMTQAQANAYGWRDGSVGSQLKQGGSSGFNALLAGRFNFGVHHFENFGNFGSFWSSTQSDTTGAFQRNLSSDTSMSFRYNLNKNYGFSVRCLKDSATTTTTASTNQNYGTALVSWEAVLRLIKALR